MKTLFGNARAGCAILLMAGLTRAADFAVTNTADAGAGTLRQAILDANDLAGPDRIIFNIDAGPFTILPASALPPVTDPVAIDGTTQPGFAGAPIIELVGTNAGVGVSGLRIFSSNCLVRALVINRFAGNGISIVTNGFNRVEGCYIGTGLSGTNDVGNTLNGIAITNSANNVLGGLSATQRNVISGNNQNGIHLAGTNAFNNQILGNVIGLGVNGADVGNSANGVFINGAPRNVVGGPAPGARNVISGNASDGVEIALATATLNVVQGNFIGTDTTGTLDRGNTGDGVHIGTGADNLIGGTNAGEGNLISGNDSDGVEISAAALNRVLGNLVGTDASGTEALGNRLNGINLNGNARTNTVGGIVEGAANRIAFNGDDGINIGTGANTNNTLRGNQIFANGELGIDLLPNGVSTNDVSDADTGPNQLQNFPVLLAATNSPANVVVVGTLGSRANTTYTLDFYSSVRCDDSGYGEGETWLGSVNVLTDAGGMAAFVADLPSPASGLFISATATDPFGNTSEFSACQRSVSLIPVQVFTVVNTNDSGPGSLRQALFDSDHSGAARSVVQFNIPGPGVQTIRPLTPLPPVLESVTIDGYSQPGAACDFGGEDETRLLIRIDGGTLPANASGLQFFGVGNEVRGLVIGHCPGSGLEFTNGGHNVVEGCFIGIDADGLTLFTNRGSGIRLSESAGNRIGGTTPCARNVISGNGITTGGGGVDIVGYQATNNVVQGCYIGTDASGTLARGNSPNGIRISLGTGNLIGGTAPGAGNVISGNDHPTIIYTGVHIAGLNSGSGAASNNVVQGNIIGLDRSGVSPLGNSYGVWADYAPANLIGGDVAAAKNVISGNRLIGVQIRDVGQGDLNMVQGNFIGTDIGGTRAIGNGNYGIEVAARRVLVGGATAVPGMPPGNVISGNGAPGFSLSVGILLSAESNRVEGNILGADASGTFAVGNYGDAIRSAIVPGNSIGGVEAGTGNVIAGTRRSNAANGNGINFGSSTNNRVFGNWIGTDRSGTIALGNEMHGIYIIGNGSYPNLATTIGSASAPNTISFNGSNGVFFTSPTPGTSNVVIRANSFYRNGSVAVDLAGSGVIGATPNDDGDSDLGANGLQNYPLIFSAVGTNGGTVVQGLLNSESNLTFAVDLFASPDCDASGSGEGRFYLGSVDVTTDGSGNGEFTATLPPLASGFVITATATHATQGTSEFSPCAVVAQGSTPRLAIKSLANGAGNDAPLELGWLKLIGDWAVETTTNLAPPVLWRPLTNVVFAEADGFRTFVWSNTLEPERYFRLASSSVFQTNAPVFITRGPYLQLGTPQSMMVRWRSNRPVNSRVAYGTDPANLTLVADDPLPVQEHAVTIAGLDPDTRYYYAVGTSDDLLIRSTNHFFWTSPVTNQPIRIWAIGDAGTVNLGNPGQVQVRNAFRNFNGNRRVNVWLMLGDNAYNAGTDAEYQTAVFNMYTNLLPQTPVWPTLGNHETAQSHSPVPTTPYLNIFTLPENGEAGGVPSGTERYYSFDYGSVHFICLDSMTSARTTNGPMAAWLRADLEANTSSWVIAFFHHPPYSKGSHDSDDGTGIDFELREMRENILPILESHGVDLVLSGHSHCYERSYLMNGHYGSSTNLQASMILNAGGGSATNGGAYTKVSEGTVYVVDGSSGQATFVQPDWPHPVMYQALLQMGSIILDIDGNQLVAQFLRETGQVQDTFTIVKQSPAAPLMTRR